MTNDTAKQAERFETVVQAILKFCAEQYSDLPALDAAGCCVIAGTRIGTVAHLDAEMPELLRHLADRFEERAAKRGQPN